MQHLLISNARFIPAANEFGIKKMMRNMLALRQNIKTIGDDSHSTQFERAKRYYSLFLLSPPVRAFVSTQHPSSHTSHRECLTAFVRSKSSPLTNTKPSSICSAASSPVSLAGLRRQRIATTTCTSLNYTDWNSRVHRMEADSGVVAEPFGCIYAFVSPLGLLDTTLRTIYQYLSTSLAPHSAVFLR